MGLAESMRQDWDARAQKDAFFYIASWRKDWGVGDFLKSGEEDYQRLVAPFFSRHGFSPEGKTMLELGCGAGRMTHSFATRFRKVIALDVSAEMIDRGQQMLRGLENINGSTPTAWISTPWRMNPSTSRSATWFCSTCRTSDSFAGTFARCSGFCGRPASAFFNSTAQEGLR